MIKMKVVLNYLSYIHYRRSLFQKIDALENIDFRVVCGKFSPLGVKSIEKADKTIYLTNRVFHFLGQNIIWQKNIAVLTLNEKPDIIISLGVNPLIFSSLTSFIIYKIKGIKVFWWGHGTLGNQGRFGKYFRLLFYKLSDGILVYNDKGKQNLIGNGISEDKIYILGNCINESDYGFNKYPLKTFKQNNSNKNRPIKFVFVGRLTKTKQVDMAIKSLNKLKKKLKFKFIIVGDGEEIQNLKQLVSDLALSDEIEFIGAKYGKAIDDILLDSDALLHPGSIGLSIIHALSFGLPVITHNDYQNQKPEFSAMIPEKTGEVFQENDMLDLSNKIELLTLKLKEGYPYWQNCIAQAKKYTPEIVANNFYKALVKK